MLNEIYAQNTRDFFLSIVYALNKTCEFEWQDKIKITPPPLSWLSLKIPPVQDAPLLYFASGLESYSICFQRQKRNTQ